MPPPEKRRRNFRRAWIFLWHLAMVLWLSHQPRYHHRHHREPPRNSSNHHHPDASPHSRFSHLDTRVARLLVSLGSAKKIPAMAESHSLIRTTPVHERTQVTIALLLLITRLFHASCCCFSVRFVYICVYVCAHACTHTRTRL
jgi:hypothetical protein